MSVETEAKHADQGRGGQLQSLKPGTPAFTHVWFWRPRMGEPDRKGKRCRIVARGAHNSIAVEIEGGELVITSRWAVRKMPDTPRNRAGVGQLTTIASIGAKQGWDCEDMLYIGWERGAIPEVLSLSELSETQADALIVALLGAMKEESEA